MELSFRFVMNREDNELFEDFAKAIGLGSETYVKDIVCTSCEKKFVFVACVQGKPYCRRCYFALGGHKISYDDPSHFYQLSENGTFIQITPDKMETLKAFFGELSEGRF